MSRELELHSEYLLCENRDQYYLQNLHQYFDNFLAILLSVLTYLKVMVVWVQQVRWETSTLLQLLSAQ